MSNKKNKITGLVITLNEEKNIAGVIENFDFVDEIIIVDSFSDDKTYEIAKNSEGVKIFQHKFINFSKQKNFALSKASHDWVVFIDADERISRKGKKEILKTVKKAKQEAYFAKFQYFYGKKPIRYSGFQTAKSHRLFRKSKCKYDESIKVHEKLIVNGTSGLLKYRLNHYSFRNYAHYKSKMKLYGSLKAKKLHEKGKSAYWLKTSAKMFYRFISHFFIRLGFLDGKVGYHISILSAYEVKVRYKKLAELNAQPKTEKAISKT
ncbi:glycosyltransferase family 2 protein [Psychroflexus aestuariivivens]|uniref:glycosyltransferase family 2 protein n=1 Tax=Psychroflexus aestuariivivens TaxID=1795040 RepID=UPI000FDAD42C|nr:glycosyltransferase family 2 protein [Psychroflexus aestuariivivens]